MSDIDTAMADSLKALDPDRPIREADIVRDLGANKKSRNVSRDFSQIRTLPKFVIYAHADDIVRHFACDASS